MIMETTIYDCFELLESIQPEWDDFAQMANCAIFMTFDWLRIWWKYYGAGRQLKIFVFRHEGQLVGIIPMFFEKIRLGPVSVRCGKIVGTDFTLSTVTLPIHKEFLPDVLEKFLTEVKNRCRWDVLHIGPLSGLYNDFDEVRRLFSQYHGRWIPCQSRVQKCSNIFPAYGFRWAGHRDSFRKTGKANETKVSHPARSPRGAH